MHAANIYEYNTYIMVFTMQTEIMVDAYLQEASWYAQDMFPEVDIIRKELALGSKILWIS